MSLIGIRQSKEGIRRSKTVCDVRPDISSAERNGRTKKKNIFSKMLRSLSKLSKRNKQTTNEKADSAVLSSSGHGSSGTDSVLNESKSNEFENVCGLPGTSFGDNSAHTHGSDSASTGYVSEGSSRRMTSSLNNISSTKPSNIDLEGRTSWLSGRTRRDFDLRPTSSGRPWPHHRIGHIELPLTQIWTEMKQILKLMKTENRTFKRRRPTSLLIAFTLQTALALVMSLMRTLGPVVQGVMSHVKLHAQTQFWTVTVSGPRCALLSVRIRL